MWVVIPQPHEARTEQKGRGRKHLLSLLELPQPSLPSDIGTPGSQVFRLTLGLILWLLWFPNLWAGTESQLLAFLGLQLSDGISWDFLTMDFGRHLISKPEQEQTQGLTHSR